MNEQQVKHVAELTRHFHQGSLSTGQYHAALVSLRLHDDDVRVLDNDAHRWLAEHKGDVKRLVAQ